MCDGFLVCPSIVFFIRILERQIFIHCVDHTMALHVLEHHHVPHFNEQYLPELDHRDGDNVSVILRKNIGIILSFFEVSLDRFSVRCLIAVCLVQLAADIIQDLILGSLVKEHSKECRVELNTNPEAGITDMLSRELGPLFGTMAPATFVFLICMVCLALTNFSSNTVATMLCCTITTALISGGTIAGICVPALAIAIGNVANFAYAAPPGGTYAAYTAGTGWVRPSYMFRVGGSISIVCGVVFSLIGYQLASWLV